MGTPERTYAIFHSTKFKSGKEMHEKYKHVSRIHETPNIKKENGKVIPPVQLYGKLSDDYRNIYESEFQNLDYYQTHKLRSDAVRGFDVILTMSNDMKDNVNIDNWSNKNLEWLKRIYGENLKSVTLHLDESTPHIHAFALPILDGKFNARGLFPKKSSFRELQDDYAKEMEEFGLSRGVKNSKATHQTMNRMNGVLNDSLEKELPFPKENESAVDYRNRVNDEYIDIHLQNAVLLDEKRRRGKIEKELIAKDKEMDQLEKKIETSVNKESNVEFKIQNWDKLVYAINHHPNEDVRKTFSGAMEEMLSWSDSIQQPETEIPSVLDLTEK